MNENKRQNVVSFYQLGVCKQKWLQMKFKPMPEPTIRDVLWNEVAAILSHCISALIQAREQIRMLICVRCHRVIFY